MTTTPSVSPSGKVALPRHRGEQLGWGLLLLLISGLLMTLSFPSPAFWFLAPVCLVPFGICILRWPMIGGGTGWAGWRWLLIYYLFGAFWFLLNLYWLYRVSFAGALVLSFFVALYWALFAIGFHRMVLHLRWSAMLALPLAWVATEYLRATVFTGFAWFILGNALAPRITFIQIADLGGVWMVSFFCAFTSGWVVDCLRLPLLNRGRISTPIRRLSFIYLAVLALVFGYGLFRLNQAAGLPGPRVAVVQVSIPQSIKDDPSDAERDQLFQQHIDLSQAALAGQPPDLIAWSETIVPAVLNPEWLHMEGYLARSGMSLTPDGQAAHDRSLRYDRALTEFARASGTSLLVGAPGRDPEIKSIMNTALLYTPSDGQVTPYYAKRYLVPFGEFVPFKSSIPWLHEMLLALTPVGGDYTLTRGPDWVRFALAPRLNAPLATQSAVSPSWRFGVPICYEDVMPGPCRAFVEPLHGHKLVDFLLSISNDGWYISRNELDQHLQMDQIRAVENRVPIARSVNGGNSGFIDSNGRIIRLVSEAGRTCFTAGVATETLPLDARVSLYSQIGDLFPIFIGIITALAVAWTIVRPRRGPVQPAPAPLIDAGQ